LPQASSTKSGAGRRGVAVTPVVQAGPARLDTEIEKYFDMSVVLLPVAAALNGIGTSITSMETVGALMAARAELLAQDRA
jgi:hypothetical protein